MNEQCGHLWTYRRPTLSWPSGDCVLRDAAGRPVYAPVAGHYYGTKMPAARRKRREEAGADE